MSQSAQIAVDEKIQLMQAGEHPGVTFLLLGDPNRPDGGIQQNLLDPILGLFGPLGGLFTS
ncbi:PE-PPE domain-containing protein [Mycobacterium sp.]|uniref:PE-PPE domain-containing protein n=1 Tax=Mycobacterium sp. TaxID=1785 RepID=UPI003C72FCB2